ncbi:MAG: HAD family hydrolase [Desulfofustis sp.]|jgi:HAD superfamily hydrolase (TIGR01549 family)|nr:HAD family hydrolase [Desulfofustis sp.]
MLKLIVFDCDGVMFDSREANRRYYNDILAAFSLPPMDEDELSFVHMHNVTDSVNHIFRHAHRELMAEVHRFRAGLDYTPYLDFMIMEADLIDFLEFARKRYKLAISTNRTTTMRPLLQTFQLDGYFDKVVTAGDVAHPKPAPDALNDILAHFNCTAGQTIYIGDSEVDRQHTEAVGVPLIAFKNPALQAHYHVETFNQIRRLDPFKG